ncbi:hypothetical protein J31TS4_25480 [Paenibacillus sp. J31TS4]|nr:hypothetical protein J31TS4_25480 [Paenibacillus sp. J31TS4]
MIDKSIVLLSEETVPRTGRIRRRAKLPTAIRARTEPLARAAKARERGEPPARAARTKGAGRAAGHSC